MTLNAQVTGNVGLYYVCYRLSLLGWNVMPTARNARGIDIIAYNGDASKIISVQVKSLSQRNAVPLGNSRDRIMGDFWVIVNKIARWPNEPPNAFIMLPDEVKSESHRARKGDKDSFWIEPPKYDVAEFREKWDRIGSGGAFT